MAIGVGGYHNMALKADGTVRAWGANDHGQSTVPAGLSNVVAVKGGWVHSIALKADGTVVAWGRNNEGQAAVPSGLSNVVAIAAGEYHNLALKADGTVVTWGWNGFGLANVPASLSTNVVAIAAGGLHSLALKADGTVTAWGWNQYGQATVPAGLSNVVAIAGGAEHSLALKSDGTVVGWGANDAWAENDPNCAIVGNQCPRKIVGQIDAPVGLSNVVALTAGVFHSVALRTDGTSSPSFRLSNPMRVGNTFNCSADTENGRVYELQYKESLEITNWTSLSLVPGTGAERVFSDSTAGSALRFYRLRQW
jgi:trimeric autotransporter adhesin